MSRFGKYVVVLHDVNDLVIKTDGHRYMLIPALSQKIKNIDSESTSVVYRRWFQLMQFTLNVKTIYGVQALDLDKQSKDGHDASIKIELRSGSEADYILSE